MQSTIDTGSSAATVRAATDLEAMRRRLITTFDAKGQSTRPDVEVLAVGLTRIRHVLVDVVERSHDLLSIRTPTSADGILANHAANVALHDRGVRMVSLFDYPTADDDARSLLGTLEGTPYHFCAGPLQMKIVDRRMVLLNGPATDGQLSVMAVTAPPAVSTAMRYWQSVIAGMVPASAVRPPAARLALSERQWQVAGLLADGAADTVIAKQLGVSVRTVRTEVATILEITRARTRFSAGVQLGRMGLLGVASS